MKNILILSLLGGSLLCGLSPAQDTSTSPASPGAAQPQQDPASTTPSQTPQTPTSQPSNSQQQQPAAMQPSEVPPTEPQGSPSQAAPSQPAQGPMATTSPSSSATPAATTPATKIAPGSIIPVQLAKTIDAKKTKVGDPVMATVTQDMKTQTGQVLVPKDTQVIGHVTEAQPRSKDQKESEVGIAFDHAVVKGDQMNLPMSIQAIVGNQPANPAAPGGDQNAPAMASGSPTAGSPSASSGGGHGGSMGSTPSQPQNYPQASNSDTQAQTQPNPRPVINGTTEGVIGISDLKLATTADATQGSVVSSEKNNVKLDKGTLMLLRVNQ